MSLTFILLLFNICRGSISHAQWREDLKLAEVTQKSGGHWQYLGHNVGKILYIKPEEALFLMESVSLIKLISFVRSLLGEHLSK